MLKEFNSETANESKAEPSACRLLYNQMRLQLESWRAAGGGGSKEGSSEHESQQGWLESSFTLKFFSVWFSSQLFNDTMNLGMLDAASNVRSRKLLEETSDSRARRIDGDYLAILYVAAASVSMTTDASTADALVGKFARAVAKFQSNALRPFFAQPDAKSFVSMVFFFSFRPFDCKQSQNLSGV
jgi:hypothetical protein